MRLPNPTSRTVRRTAAALLASFGLAGGACTGRDASLYDRYGEPVHPTDPTMTEYGPTPRPTTIYRTQSPPIERTSARIPEGAQPVVRIAAMVGDVPVYDFEVKQAVAQRMGELNGIPPSAVESKIAEIRREELRRLVERELLLADMTVKLSLTERPELQEKLREAAEKESDKRFRAFMKLNGISDPVQFGEILERQGLSEKGMRRQIERGFLMMEYVRQVIAPRASQPSLGELRNYYDRHRDEFRSEDYVEWQDLFVRADKFATREEGKRFAESLADRARAGEDFVELVKKYDQGDSRLRNGTGLGNKPGEIRPSEVEQAVWRLSEGQVGPPVEMSGGYHIVRVAKRTRAGQRPFDAEVQKEVLEQVLGERGEQEYKRVIAELRRATPVVVYEQQN